MQRVTTRTGADDEPLERLPDLLLITQRGGSEPPCRHGFRLARVRIGRDAPSEIRVADSTVSRVHAEIALEEGRWVARDLQSRNGTRLNGRQLADAEVLRQGDELWVGSSVLTVYWLSQATDETAEIAETESARPMPRSAAAGSPPMPAVLVGDSDAIRTVRTTIDRVAPTTATVLLLGEPGTGKEIAARLLHDLSGRSAGPFVVVNCPALASGLVESDLFGVERGVATGVEARVGKLEMAHGGTLFLDEVGDLALEAQAKLLRFVQERKVERVGGRGERAVDVRVVAATNRNLEAAVRAGKFRADLLDRLDQVRLTMPPLRSRREDVPALVAHFLHHDFGRPMDLSESLLQEIARSGFPGNVRQLRNLVARIGLDLPPSSETAPSAAAVASAEAAAELPEQLLARMLDGRETFWDVVREPFMRRRLSREDARRVVTMALERTGTYRELASLLGMDSFQEYKKLLNFLRDQRLRPDDD